MALKAKRTIPFCFQVYSLKNRVNGKMYFGKTSYPISFRKYGHKSAYDRNRGSVLHKAIHKYGWDNFDLKIIYEGVSEKEINAVEKAMIAQYRTMVPFGYNVTAGGDGALGVKQSADVIEKRAAKIRGVRRPDMSLRLRGVKRAPEIGAKISASKKGAIIPPHVREAQRLAVTGKPCPEHVRELNRAARLGKTFQLCVAGKLNIAIAARLRKQRSGRPIIEITKNGVIGYASTKAAASVLGLTHTHITKVLNGECPHAKRHVFRYAI